MAKKFKLRGNRTQVTTLNKKMIAIVAAVVFAVLILAFVEALMPKKASTSNQGIGNGGGPRADMDKSVGQLPGYDDFAEINRLLQQEKQHQDTSATDKLRAQLASFQQQQQSLLAQIQALKEQHQQQPTQQQAPQQTSEEDRQAQNSEIFFAGGAPDLGSEKKLLTAEIAAQKKAAAAKTGAAAGGVKEAAGSFAQQNMQGNKVDFLNPKDGGDSTFSPHVMMSLRSPYEILQGTFIPATLITGTNSDLPGSVKAQVRQNVYDTVSGKRLLIPQGSILIGSYNSNIAYGQTRVQMAFTRLIRPDGSSIQLSKPQAMDDTGINGLTGDVNNHWWRVVGSALLVTAFSLPAAVVQTYNPTPPSTISGGAQNVAGYSVLNGVSQIGNQIASHSLNVQPTITLPEGKMLSIMVQKDMIIPPYKQGK